MHAHLTVALQTYDERKVIINPECNRFSSSYSIDLCYWFILRKFYFVSCVKLYLFNIVITFHSCHNNWLLLSGNSKTTLLINIICTKYKIPSWFIIILQIVSIYLKLLPHHHLLSEIYFFHYLCFYWSENIFAIHSWVINQTLEFSQKF